MISRWIPLKVKVSPFFFPNIAWVMGAEGEMTMTCCPSTSILPNLGPMKKVRLSKYTTLPSSTVFGPDLFGILESKWISFERRSSLRPSFSCSKCVIARAVSCLSPAVLFDSLPSDSSKSCNCLSISAFRSRRKEAQWSKMVTRLSGVFKMSEFGGKVAQITFYRGISCIDFPFYASCNTSS